nr:reverse transcriptase domain-containing protein [Tanacetum cinerariifolium]
MLLVTQIDTFYNGLTLRHQDTINATAGGTFMKKRPEECYDLIENMTTHHNHWDTSATRDETYKTISFTTTTESPKVVRQLETMNKNFHDMMRQIQSVKYVNPKCETYGGPNSFTNCPAVGGYTQEVAYYYSFIQMHNPSGSGSLPSNTVANLRGDVKAITTQSGVAYEGPSIPPISSSLPKEVEREPKVTKDKVQTTRPESTVHVHPPVVRYLISEPDVALKPNPKLSIPYPSRLNDQKLQEKTNSQMLKFLQIFQRLHFDLSFADSILHIPTVLLKKLPKILGDPRRILIPCDFHELESCMALADLGSSINLIPLSIWKKLSLPNLTPTHMTLELATRETLLEDDSCSSRCTQRRAYLRDDDEKLIFHANSTLKHPHKHGNESINMINFIDITCEDRFPEVLKFKKLNYPSSGSTTPLYDSSPNLTPFETSNSLLEEFADELALLDPFPPGNKDENFDLEADLRKIKYFLNQNPSTKSNVEIIDPILEKFTDEPALDYLPPPGDDDDDLFDLNSDNDEWKMLLYGDCYNGIDFEKDKNKGSKMKLLVVEDHIVELNDLLPQLLDNESTLPEESSEMATLSSSPFRNEDKVFKPGILIWEELRFSMMNQKIRIIKRIRHLRHS